MTVILFEKIQSLYRSTDTVYRGLRFWPLALTTWGAFSCGLFLSIEVTDYLSGAGLSDPIDVLSDFAFIATCLTIEPIIAVLFTTWLWRLLAIRLIEEGIVHIDLEDDIIRWTNIEVISVKKGRRKLSVKMLDSESSRIVILRLNPERYLEFCRKSLELAPEDTQIARFLKNEINRVAEI